MPHTYSWEKFFSQNSKPLLLSQAHLLILQPSYCTLKPTKFMIVHLQQKAPFCFFPRQTWNNSYPWLGTIPPHLCNHTSCLFLPSGQSVYHVLESAGPSYGLTKTPSAYGIYSLVRLSWWVHCQFQTTHKFPRKILFAIDFSCCPLTHGMIFSCGTTTCLYLPINLTGTCILVYPTPDIGFLLP